MSVVLGCAGILGLYQEYIFFPTHKEQRFRLGDNETQVFLKNWTEQNPVNSTSHADVETNSFNTGTIIGIVLAVLTAVSQIGESFSVLCVQLLPLCVGLCIHVWCGAVCFAFTKGAGSLVPKESTPGQNRDDCENVVFSAVDFIFSYHLQEVKLVDLFFWNSILGTATSFLLAWPLEDWVLPQDSVTWALLCTHCMSAALCMFVGWIPLYRCSVFVTVLSYNTALVFLFLIQWAVLRDLAGSPGLYVEVLGAVLVMISSFLVPVYDFVVDKCKQKETNETVSSLLESPCAPADPE